MESYIPEFQDEREKKSEIIVTVSGQSKTGKSTLAEHISRKLDIKHFSAGDFFRELAEERGLTVEELSEKAEKEVDVEVDRRTLEKSLKFSSVVDGRLSKWVLGDYTDLSIYLKAGVEERARRLCEEREISLSKAKKLIKKRDEDNRKRYQQYYGIDTSKTDIYDVIIDNSDISIEKQNELIENILEQVFPEKYNK